MSEEPDDDANVPDYAVGGGKVSAAQKTIAGRKKHGRGALRVRVIRPKTKSHKPAKRK